VACVTSPPTRSKPAAAAGTREGTRIPTCRVLRKVDQSSSQKQTQKTESEPSARKWLYHSAAKQNPPFTDSHMHGFRPSLRNNRHAKSEEPSNLTYSPPHQPHISPHSPTSSQLHPANLPRKFERGHDQLTTSWGGIRDLAIIPIGLSRQQTGGRLFPPKSPTDQATDQRQTPQRLGVEARFACEKGKRIRSYTNASIVYSNSTSKLSLPTYLDVFYNRLSQCSLRNIQKPYQHGIVLKETMLRIRGLVRDSAE